MTNKDQFVRELRVVHIKNVIITRPLLIKKIVGIDRVSLFDTTDRKTRVKWNMLATVSILKNRLRFWKNDNYYFIFNVWSNGYYHWLVESAIKLVLFEKEIRAGVVVLPERSPSFITELLSVAGFTNYRKMNGSCFIRNLKVVSNPLPGHPNPEHVQKLRAYLLEKIPAGAAHYEKIYISRKKAARRKVVNEAEVINFLESKGFYCVEMEGMPWVEQVKLFHYCRVLVSIHGAGLTNVLFMPADAKMIEIYPGLPGEEEMFVNHCYESLSKALDVKHQFLFSRRERADDKPDFRSDNVYVDLAQLESMI